MPRADLDAEDIAEPFGRGHQQFLAVGNRSAHVIRQSAVGERDVAAAFEDENFGEFIHAAQPCRARSSAGHSADNQNPPRCHDLFLLL